MTILWLLEYSFNFFLNRISAFYWFCHHPEPFRLLIVSETLIYSTLAIYDIFAVIFDLFSPTTPGTGSLHSRPFYYLLLNSLK